MYCESHHRWFVGAECDWCLHEISSLAEYKAWLRTWQTAFPYAVILSAHSGCGHLITDLIPLPDGRHLSVLELQMVCFTFEHAEVLG